MRMRAQINIAFYSTIKNASKFATWGAFYIATDQQVAAPHGLARRDFWIEIMKSRILFLRVINKCKIYHNLHKKHLAIYTWQNNSLIVKLSHEPPTTFQQILGFA